MENNGFKYENEILTITDKHAAEVLAKLYTEPATYEILADALELIYGQITHGLDDAFYEHEYRMAEEYYALAIADIRKAIAHLTIADNLVLGID